MFVLTPGPPNLPFPFSFCLHIGLFPYAFLREQAAALSDPAYKCLTHSKGGHKQPTTFGVFTCVADARFLLRALVLTRKRAKGLGSLLVLDIGSPPPQDAGGITAGRAWDLRKTKTSQVGEIKRCKCPHVTLLLAAAGVYIGVLLYCSRLPDVRVLIVTRYLVVCSSHFTRY